MSRVVVVTGASAGIGRAAARHFGKEGWRVALLAGGEALVIPTDVANYDQVEAAAEHVEREWGPIDVWVNDAMATIFCEFTQITPEDYRRATEVTYLATVC